jgi:uncharacterized membrane protein YedE/YeeE
MNFTETSPIIGGLLIGLSASILMITNGKICGLSGIFSSLIFQFRESWRWVFIAGFLFGSLLIRLFVPSLAQTYAYSISSMLTVIAGFLVGFGTKMGGGCTSGHGICGVSRLSKRSIIATLIFMGCAMLTVWLRKKIW